MTIIEKYRKFNTLLIFFGVICILVSSVGLFVSTQIKEKKIKELQLLNTQKLKLNPKDSSEYFLTKMNNLQESTFEEVKALKDSIDYYKRKFIDFEYNQNNRKLKNLSSNLVRTGTVDSVLYELRNSIVILPHDNIVFFLNSNHSYFEFFDKDKMEQIKYILGKK